MTIRAERSARWLDVVVHDDGRGLPDGFSLEKSDRLGLQIVRTLVSAELDGSLGMHDVPTGGTDVVLRVPLGRRRGSRSNHTSDPVVPNSRNSLIWLNSHELPLHKVTAPTISSGPSPRAG